MKSVRWFSGSSMLSITVRPLRALRTWRSRRRWATRDRIYTEERARRMNTGQTIDPGSIVWRLVGTTWKPVDMIRGAGYLLADAAHEDRPDLSSADLVDLGMLFVHLADRIDEDGI